MVDIFIWIFLANFLFSYNIRAKIFFDDVIPGQSLTEVSVSSVWEHTWAGWLAVEHAALAGVTSQLCYCSRKKASGQVNILRLIYSYGHLLFSCPHDIGITH